MTGRGKGGGIVPDPADRRTASREVADELRFHYEQRVREYMEAGLDEAAARARASARMGDLRAVQRECASLLVSERRAVRRRDLLGDLWQDVRFGARSAARAPLFTALAVAILAIGIGANTAVVSVLKAVLVDPLPYADEGALARVYGHRVGEETPPAGGPLSAANYQDYRARQRSFADVRAFQSQALEVTFQDGGDPLSLLAARGEPGLLELLGVSPVLGRTPTVDDIGQPVVLLSHGAWQRLFGGLRDVLGRDVSIDGQRRTVVGVLPRGFVGPMGAADFWLPLNMQPWLDSPISARRSHWLGVVGRLKPGAGLETGRSEARAIGDDLARAHPSDNAGFTLGAVPLRDALAGDTRTPLLIVMAAAALVLLVTCANLAGALLSRMLARRGEFAVRLALGAGRGRLVRQLLTESTLLGLAGGAAGVLVAHVAVTAFARVSAEVLPAYAELRLDGPMLFFAFAAALATGLAFGLYPALAMARSRAGMVLREEGRGASESRRTGRARGALVAVQVAFSVSLVVGATLLVRSFWAMTVAPLGFEPDDVLTASVQLPGQAYATEASTRQFFDAFEERLRALAGVEAVASTAFLPHAVLSRAGLSIEGVTWPSSSGQPFVLITSVSDGYFGAMRIPVREGRTFDGRDRLDAPQAIVVSESMARRYWPDGGAIGARVRLGPNLEAPWAHVVGVVGDVRTDATRRDQEPMAYLSSRQASWPRRFVIVRAQGDPLALVAPVRRALAAADPALPLITAATLRDEIAESLDARRLPVVLIAGFGATALLLASIGVYALFASMAAAREREFGLRMALGARRRTIVALVLRQGGAPLAAGLLGGTIVALLGARALRHLLFGIGPFDAAALAVSAATIIVCAAVALIGPVRRATRVEPMRILR